MLVTGASGFVGGHLVARLSAAGAAVTGVLLPGEDPGPLRRRVRALGGADFEVVAAAFSDQQAWRRLLGETRDVVHLAGCMRGDDPRRYQRANVDLVSQLVAAPGWTEDHRLVVMSSVAACGPSGPEAPRSETAPAAPVGLYGGSKRCGEEQLLGADLPARVLVLRPPSIYGPGDESFRDAFRLAARGLYPALGPRHLRFQLVLVHDVVAAVARALVRLGEDPAPPRLLHMGNPAVLDHEAWRTLFERARGGAVRAVYLGTWGTRALGWWGHLVERVTGRPQLLGRDKVVHLLAGDWVHDLSGFDREVGGVAWTDHAEGTRLTLAAEAATP